MLGGNRHRIAEAERVGLVSPLHAGAALGLVRDQDDGTFRAPDKVREPLVVGGEAGAAVDHEQNDVGLGDRRLGLGAHAALERALVGMLEPRGVDDPEDEVAQPPLALAAIAGHARAIVHEGQTLADETVEQRRLADIGSADDRHGDAGSSFGHRRAPSPAPEPRGRPGAGRAAVVRRT